MSADVPTLAAWRARWPALRRWLLPLFGLLVLGLLVSRARQIDWPSVGAALRAYRPGQLAQAGAFVLGSHVLFAGFDLLGRRHTGHCLSAGRTWLIALASYAFNLNLGALLGGVALRSRLYAKAGLEAGTIAQVVSVSMATNWLGYGVFAGGLFAFGLLAPPPQAAVSPLQFRLLGAGMLLLAGGYLLLCRAKQGQEWEVRGRRVRLPSLRLALLQMAVSVLNWSMMGAAIHLLLGAAVPYGMAVGTLMAAAVVGVVTPIPAGLGVLEAVYLALLGGTLPQGRILGAVLAYRALYYLAPLGLALVLYAVLSRRSPRS